MKPKRKDQLDPKEERERIELLTSKTPEQRERDKLEARKTYDRLAAGARLPFEAPVEEFDGTLESTLKRVTEQVHARDRARMSLPCYQAMYPAGEIPDDASKRIDDSVGSRACEQAQAWRDCEYALTGELCPRVRLADTVEKVDRTMTRAFVPNDDRDVIMAAVRGQKPLKALDSLVVVRSLRRREPMTVRLQNAAEQLVGGRERPNEVWLKGDERIVVMGGNPGRGKTTSAVYLLAYEGGMYITEYQLSRPPSAGGASVRDAVAAKVLVIDQVGRANIGDSRYLVSQMEEVIDRRKAQKMLTILVGNFDLATFKARYEELVMSRIFGHGVFVLFGGDDMRLNLRSV